LPIKGGKTCSQDATGTKDAWRLPEEKKQTLRNALEQEEISIQKETRKPITTADFESLVVVGRGAFGEVRLVRRKNPDKTDPSGGQIFALKSMKKEMMVLKNQVGHVKAERDALAIADENNRWLTVLHYSFTDATHLYMVMEFMPGGDLMSLLMKEDTFSEIGDKILHGRSSVCDFFGSCLRVYSPRYQTRQYAP
jgi:serine/threonine kinase 38